MWLGRVTALKLREGVSMAETEYGVALLDEQSGQYFNLNPPGGLILTCLLNGKTSDEAARRLTTEYDVDIDTAARDVRDLVGQLESAGLTDEAEAG